MNLLSLILIAMALIVGGCVFYVAWELSSGRYEIGGHPRTGQAGTSDPATPEDEAGPAPEARER